MFQFHTKAFRVDGIAGESVASSFGCDVIEKIKTEAGKVAASVGFFVDEIETGADAAFAVEVKAPAREEPAVFGFTGDGVGVASEHDAVGVEEEGPPVGAGAGQEVVAKFFVERLA